MEIRIADAVVPAGDVTHNAGGVGFGRFDSDTIEVSPYSIRFTAAEIVEALSAAYDAACREILDDDLRSGDTSDFTRVGYCGLAEAIAAFPDALGDILDTYLREALFEHFIPRAKGWRYVINSVDSVEVSPDCVLLRGRCFRHVRGPGALMAGT